MAHSLCNYSKLLNSTFERNNKQCILAIAVSLLGFSFSAISRIQTAPITPPPPISFKVCLKLEAKLNGFNPKVSFSDEKIEGKVID